MRRLQLGFPWVTVNYYVATAAWSVLFTSFLNRIPFSCIFYETLSISTPLSVFSVALILDSSNGSTMSAITIYLQR